MSTYIGKLRIILIQLKMKNLNAILQEKTLNIIIIYNSIEVYALGKVINLLHALGLYFIFIILT